LINLSFENLLSALVDVTGIVNTILKTMDMLGNEPLVFLKILRALSGVVLVSIIIRKISSSEY